MDDLYEIDIENLAVGHEVEANILNENGAIIIHAGVVVNQNMLDSLRRKEINKLFSITPIKLTAKQLIKKVAALSKSKDGIQELKESSHIETLEKEIFNGTYDVEITADRFEHDIAQLEAGTRSQEHIEGMEKFHQTLVGKVQDLYINILKGHKDAAASSKAIIQSILRVFGTDRIILVNLCNYDYKGDDYLFTHVLNVSIMTMITATSMGYSREDVFNAGLAALLSDIGMLFISKEIRTSKKALTDDQRAEIYNHPIISASVLDGLDLPGVIRAVVYQVHEREDGTGYPKGILGEQIHPFSKMVAMCDTYMAMSGARAYKTKEQPHLKVKALYSMASSGKFDMVVMKKFLAAVSYYPIGSLVKLTDGRYAKVVESNPKKFACPIVAFISDSDGNELPRHLMKWVDLLHVPDVQIEDSAENSLFNNNNSSVGF